MDFPKVLFDAFKDAVVTGTITRAWADDGGNHIQFHAEASAFSKVFNEAENLLEQLRIEGKLEDAVEVIVSTWYPGKTK